MHPFLVSYLMFFSKMRKKTKRKTCYLDSRMTLLGAVKGSPRVDSSAGGSRERAGEKLWEQRNEALGEAPD